MKIIYIGVQAEPSLSADRCFLIDKAVNYNKQKLIESTKYTEYIASYSILNLLVS